MFFVLFFTQKTENSNIIFVIVNKKMGLIGLTSFGSSQLFTEKMRFERKSFANIADDFKQKFKKCETEMKRIEKNKKINDEKNEKKINDCKKKIKNLEEQIKTLMTLIEQISN